MILRADKPSEDGEWIVAEVDTGDSESHVFSYLSAKPEGWDTIPLTQEISLTWPFDPEGPTEALFARMNELEDALTSLCSGDQSCLALVITSPTAREWCFYARDYPEFMRGLNACLANRPRFPINVEHSPDPEWRYWHTFVDRIKRQR